MLEAIQFDIISRMVLCRVVYLVRAVDDEQFERVWRFVCDLLMLHNEQWGLPIRFHQKRFEAVGSNWSRALYANWRMYWGWDRMCSDQIIISLLWIPFIIALADEPWHSRLRKCCNEASLCFARSCFVALPMDLFIAISASKITWIFLVSVQICCISGCSLFFRENLFFRRSFSYVCWKEGIPKPHFDFDVVINSWTQADGGRLSQFLIWRVLSESMLLFTHVVPSLYSLSSKVSCEKMYCWYIFSFVWALIFKLDVMLSRLESFCTICFLASWFFSVEIKNLSEISEGGANCDGWNFVVVQVNCWFDLAEYVS